MAIAFDCEHCRKHYEVSDSLGGKRVKCKQCGQALSVPVPRRSDSVIDAPVEDPYDLGDRYAMTDTQVPPRQRTAGSGAEVLPSGQPSKVSGKKKRKSDEVSWTLANLPGWAFGAYLAAIGGLLLAALLTGGEVKLFLVMGGILLCAAPFALCGLAFRYGPAFREGFGCGLMCMFVPFYGWYFRARHRDKRAVKLPRLRGRGLFPLVLSIAYAPLFLVAVKEADEDIAKRPRPQQPVHFVFHAKAGNERPAPKRRIQEFTPRDASPEPGSVPARAPTPAQERKQDRPSPAPPRMEPDALAVLPGSSVGASGAPEPEPAPAAESAYQQHERLAREVLDRMNELTGLLATVGDVPSASQAAARVRELAKAFDDAQRRFDRLPRLSSPEAEMLAAGTQHALKAAVDHYADEAERVQSIPGVNAVLTRDLLAFRAFLPGTDLRIALHNRASPMPSARPAPPAPDLGSSLTLIVSGVADDATRKSIDDAIAGAMNALGVSWRSRSSSSGGRSTYTISPAADPQSFAARMTFGTVTRIAGQSIEIVVNPSRTGVGASGDSPLVNQALADLVSSAPNQRKSALQRLVNERPTGHRKEVARAVRPLLKDPDGFTRADAIRVLGNWGGPEDILAMTEVLKTPPGFGIRFALYDALTKLKDPQAAGPLAEMLPSNDRNLVVPVLKALGTPAEEDVRKYLEHRDLPVRTEAANILQTIGGPKSVAALKKLAGKGSGPDAEAARRALQAIATRGVDGKSPGP